MTNPPSEKPDQKARDPSQENPEEKGNLGDKEDCRGQIKGFGFVGEEPDSEAVVAECDA